MPKYPWVRGYSFVLQSRIPFSLEQLENLGEALLDFTSMADLDAWLAALKV